MRRRLMKALLVFVLLVFLVAGGITLFRSCSDGGSSSQSGNDTGATIAQGICLEDVSLGGMTKAEAKEAIETWIEELSWNVQLQYRDTLLELDKYLSCSEELLEELLSQKEATVYTVLSLYDEEKAAAILAEIAQEYDTEAEAAYLSGYDVSTGSLVFADETVGYQLDQEAKLACLKETVTNRNFHNTLNAIYQELSSGYTLAQARQDYQKLASFTTTTSSGNTARDTNITLACAAVSGTVVAPGETFSILELIGDTTEEKGYQAAGAYSDGVVVNELGGGICQVSTTLYNAVVLAGLDTTERHYHSMAVHYVNLGEDAMISWPGSDLQFVNNSEGTILVIMSYSGNTVSATIYGIPILEEGVTQVMESEILETYEMEPEYIEDETLEPGTVVLVSSGDTGYKVVTYLVTYKNGVEISRELLHYSVYKVRNPVYRRNSTESTTEAETEATEAETAQTETAQTEAAQIEAVQTEESAASEDEE